MSDNPEIPEVDLEQDVLSEREMLHDLEIVDESRPDRVIKVIRTSDRILFKRCRRRWAWQSHLRYNLGPVQKASPLWLGSGIHYALEDFHGYQQHKRPRDAFIAYCNATAAYNGKSLPETVMDDIRLGVGMMDYYELWLQGRDPLATYVFQGKLQTEVNFKIKLPWPEGKFGIDDVYYSGQIDRVVEDSNGQLWLMEYKTAKAMFMSHFLTDPQVGSYMWGAYCIYPKPIVGVIYQQHKKMVPKAPKILAKGTISTAEHQTTTHRHYRQALINIYGEVSNAPAENVKYLNKLAMAETPDMDAFIRRDRVYRNFHSVAAEGAKIMMEVEEMLNPDLPLYPNPTRQCAMECPFGSACVSIDDGSDWEYELNLTMEPREKSYDSWRAFLRVPQNILNIEAALNEGEFYSGQ